MLNCISVHDTSISSVTVTGYFGPKTREGIMKFQKKMGLSQTGRADRATIMQMSDAQRHHENEVNTSFRQYPGYILKPGMRDSEIQSSLLTTSTPISNLQTMLRMISVASPDIPSVIPDGIYNQRTEAAVRAVQRGLGLPATGETDYTTWEAIYNEYTQAMLSLSDPLKVSPFPVSNKPILMAESGDYIYFTQIMLNRLANNIPGIATVEINAVLDDATRKDITEIQRLSGLEQTGMLDKNTWNAIVTMYEAVIRGYTVF
jgi:peptidoglycan hydrolase-like protein with peptidoglycan-binding domain